MGKRKGPSCNECGILVGYRYILCPLSIAVFLLPLKETAMLRNLCPVLCLLFLLAGCMAKAPEPVAVRIPDRLIDYQAEVKPFLTNAVWFATPATTLRAS